MLAARPVSRIATFARRAALVVAGSALLAVSAQIAVPMWPVPITLQTLAIPILVALLGRGLGTAAVVAYLAEAAAGLPVLQGFSGGAAHLAGTTGGYLTAFPFAAWLIGAFYEHGFARDYARRFAAVFIGTSVVFAGGAAWLAFGLGLGPSRALALGVMPFLIGDVAKCLIAAAVVPRRAETREA